MPRSRLFTVESALHSATPRRILHLSIILGDPSSASFKHVNSRLLTHQMHILVFQPAQLSMNVICMRRTDLYGIVDGQLRMSERYAEKSTVYFRGLVCVG